MNRFVASVAVVLGLSQAALGQNNGRLLATGANVHAGWLQTKAQSLDRMPTDSEAALLGLQIHWLKTAESYQPYVGDPGAQLWPDNVDQDARVVLKSGNRVVAVIHANQRDIDYARYGMFDRSSSAKPALLGMEGARKVAEAIAADYKLLNRSITIEEVVAPKTYLTVASDRGGIEMFDAETGERLWKNSLGNGTLPVVGPTVSNDMVCVLIGAKAFVMDKSTGQILHEDKLDASVSTMPVAIGKTLFVPEVNGMLATHDRDDVMGTQASFGFTNALQYPPIASPDGTMVAWALGRYVYTAKRDARIELWSRVETLGKVTSTPTLATDGFVFATDDGTVIKTNFERYNSITWRENVGFPVLSRPLCNDKVVIVISADGVATCLDAKTGHLAWTAKVPGIANPLGMSQTHAYFQDLAGGLVSISIEDGHVVGRIVKSLAKGIRNDYSDRIYLRGLDGRIMCLREIEQTEPSFLPIVQVMRGVAVPESKKPEASEPETPDTPPSEESPTDSGNPFGGSDSPFGSGDDAGSNPFGGDTGSPFGGDAPAASDNPFGS